MDDAFNEIVVVKRSGQRVPFNSLKIALAIKGAFDSIQSDYLESDVNRVFQDTLKNIKDSYTDRKTINVENIQDIIESTLKKDRYDDVYNSFSNYRLRRAESRKAFSEKNQHKFVKAIEKIGTLENNKTDGLLTFNRFAQTISEEYNRAYIIDHKFLRAHDEGRIYIHNLAYFNLGYFNETNLLTDNLLDEDNDFIDLFVSLVNASKEITNEITINDFDIMLDNYFLNKYRNLFKERVVTYLEVNGYSNLIDLEKLSDLIDKTTILKLEIFNYPELDNNEVIKRALTIIHKNTLEEVKNNTKKQLNSLFRHLEEEMKSFSFNIGNGSICSQILILDELNKLVPLKHVSIIYKVHNDMSKEINEHLALAIINNQNIYLTTKSIAFSTGLVLKDGKENISEVSINIGRLWLKYGKLSREFYQELDEMLDLSRNTLNFVFETIGDKVKENYRYLFNGNIKDDEKLEENQQVRKVIKGGSLDFNLIGLTNCDDYKEVLKYINKRINSYKEDFSYNYTLSCINNKEASSYMLQLDKAIFGPKSKSYDELFNPTKLDFADIEEYDKLLDGGYVINIMLNKNSGMKAIIDIMDSISKHHLGLTKIRMKSGL